MFFFTAFLSALFFPLSLHFPLFLFPISLADTSLLSILPSRPFYFLCFTLPAGFELSILYRLRQTSSLSSIQLIYMCFLPIKGNFQNYISNTLFKFQKLTVK